jgi:8-oxo-dGTP pyrophosphatase MutT (NUDIX family)
MSHVCTSLEDALIPLDEPPRGPGWNHAGIADWLGDEPLLPAAVLVGVRAGGEQDAEFTRRHDRLAHHAAQDAFPGGSMDAQDTDMVDTALRETEEEVGLPRSMITPLGFLDCFETISGFCITPVVARIGSDAPPLAANADEVAEVFEVPLAFFLDPASMHRYTKDYRGATRPMVEFRAGNYRIWGATAAMLYNLLERMGVA